MYYFTNVDNVVINNVIIYNKNFENKPENSLCFEVGKEYYAEILNDGFCLSKADVLKLTKLGILTNKLINESRIIKKRKG